MYPVKGDVDVWDLVEEDGPEPGPVLLLALRHHAGQLGHPADSGEGSSPLTPEL